MTPPDVVISTSSSSEEPKKVLHGLKKPVPLHLRHRRVTSPTPSSSSESEDPSAKAGDIFQPTLEDQEYVPEELDGNSDSGGAKYTNWEKTNPKGFPSALGVSRLLQPL